MFNPNDRLALYIHLPWCIRRCPYCDFNAHTFKGTLPEQRYIEALKADLIQTHRTQTLPPLQSIFFGGGTPSLFKPDSIYQILHEVNQMLGIPPSCEITLEANPGTLEAQKLRAFAQAGINRLSLGIQSFHDPALKALGRIHDAKSAHHACETALTAGFNAINIDLMFGLPQQTRHQALDDLKQALDYPIKHLSWYELTIEPNTLFAHKPPQRPNTDTRAIWTKDGHEILKESGFIHYEVSAFCKPGFACQHNLWVWQFGDYLGLGAGAHSKHTHPHGIERTMRYKSPQAYMAHTQPIHTQHIVPPDEHPFEYMLNRLRLLTPVCWKITEALTGVHANTPAIKTAISQGLIQSESTTFQLTQKGRWFLDEVVTLFLV